MNPLYEYTKTIKEDISDINRLNEAYKLDCESEGITKCCKALA